MIQQVDIDDMKPQYKYIVVERLTGIGNIEVEGPFVTKGNAEAVLKMLQKRYPKSEFHVHAEEV